MWWNPVLKIVVALSSVFSHWTYYMMHSCSMKLINFRVEANKQSLSIVRKVFKLMRSLAIWITYIICEDCMIIPPLPKY